VMGEERNRLIERGRVGESVRKGREWEIERRGRER
jgi:hypothetical protein